MKSRKTSKPPKRAEAERQRRSLKRMVRELREFASDCARCAECMEREIRDGVCIRQSAESKQARADVLRLHERWALETLKLSNHY